MSDKDAFELWRMWEEQPPDGRRLIPAAIPEAVMALAPDERRARDKVNAAVRDGLKLGPLHPAGSADRYGVPIASE